MESSSLSTENEDSSCLSAWMISQWLQEIDATGRSWRTNNISSPCVVDAFNLNASRTKLFLKSTENSRKLFWNTVGRTFQIGTAYSFTENEDYPCLFMWTISKLAGKKQNIDPLWKILMKDVDLGEPTTFFDHVYLGCTQRECKTSKDIVDNYKDLFESRMSVGGIESLLCSEKSEANISSWSYDMGHAKKCVERYCELANKTTQQVYKVATPCIDDHQFISKKKDLLENCQRYAHTLF